MGINRVPARWRWMLLLPIVCGSAFRASTADTPVTAGKSAAAPVVMGLIERAMVFPGNIEFRAKLDTGSRTSSIHTTKALEFRRGEARWVAFTIDNGRGASVDLELPVKRHVRIRKHGGTYQRRPVVKMAICIGDLYKETEVNLVDRSGFIYPLLIGRSFLKGDILVDAGVTRTQEPRCRSASQQGDGRSAVP